MKKETSQGLHVLVLQNSDCKTFFSDIQAWTFGETRNTEVEWTDLCW